MQKSTIRARLIAAQLKLKPGYRQSVDPRLGDKTDWVLSKGGDAEAAVVILEALAESDPNTFTGANWLVAAEKQFAMAVPPEDKPAAKPKSKPKSGGAPDGSEAEFKL